MHDIDLAQLDHRGYVRVNGFLPGELAAEIVGHWKHKAERNVKGKSNTFAPDGSGVERVKEQLARLAWKISRSSATTLTPDPAAANCTDHSAYFHIGDFDGPAANRIRGGRAGNKLPLHIDRNTLWEYTGNNTEIGFLNFYLPLAKPAPNTGNLRVFPFDTNPQVNQLRGIGARVFPTGKIGDPHLPMAAGAAVEATDGATAAADGATVGRVTEGSVALVAMPGSPMWCPSGGRQSRYGLTYEEPYLDVGDMLIVRGDVMHMSGPCAGFRLAMSVRMWDRLPTTEELQRWRARATCSAQRTIIDNALKVKEPRDCAAF